MTEVKCLRGYFSISGGRQLTRIAFQDFKNFNWLGKKSGESEDKKIRKALELWLPVGCMCHFVILFLIIRVKWHLICQNPLLRSKVKLE